MRIVLRSLAGLLAVAATVGGAYAARSDRPDYADGYTQQPTSADGLHIRSGGYWRCAQQATWPHRGTMCGLAYMVYPDDSKVLIRYHSNGLFSTEQPG
ncbi:hypothetical protein ACTOB_001263 [Actinoplanes oblitus]|uniref:Uncharacterized protein n=1 Tax=Actinoplanes oblitus TaxID=3040509 RepID=A0ABY8WLJ5_9ACTN|nr:hypothetical protein [Actinoplanes oblitus]WIM97715.1 hypothetical protein ACTOB_001263 [Actinoplanes oblitus]